MPLILQNILYLTGVVSSKTEQFESFLLTCKNPVNKPNFVYEIIVLILFHQSLDLNELFPNPVNFTNEEILRYLSPRLVYLLYVLHKADHNSYNVAINPDNWFNNELIKERANSFLKLFSENLNI